MSRLSRFESFRFVGTRDSMRVYDCDEPEQFTALEERLDQDDLVNRKLVQSFAPDSLSEAANRGFRPVD
ncbi:MAG: hypothetical protein WAL25_00405 [Acidimicrobiia bacterium]